MEKSNGSLTGEERSLWKRVDELWKCSIDRDFKTIEKALHPKYTGWDNKSLVPHDRNYAIDSIKDSSFRLLEYSLYPLQISVYEHQVGIVNYRYEARIRDIQKNIRAIKGRWTEVFLRKEQNWILIGVHGGPEPLKVESSKNVF